MEVTTAGGAVQRETRLFETRVTKDSLVLAFPHATQIVSWAPLNGGLRTHANRILIHRIEPDFNCADGAAVLRRAASKAGLTGTTVGMFTAGEIDNYKVAEAGYKELRTSALCIASLVGLATVGEPGSFVERDSGSMSGGAINLVVGTNYSLTHEAMLEGMAIATEAKVRVLHEFDMRSRATNEPATGSSLDCVAVVAGHDRRYCFAGKNTKWGELIGKVCLDTLRSALRAGLSRAEDLHRLEPKSQCQMNLRP